MKNINAPVIISMMGGACIFPSKKWLYSLTSINTNIPAINIPSPETYSPQKWNKCSFHTFSLGFRCCVWITWWASRALAWAADSARPHNDFDQRYENESDSLNKNKNEMATIRHCWPFLLPTLSLSAEWATYIVVIEYVAGNTSIPVHTERALNGAQKKPRELGRNYSMDDEQELPRFTWYRPLLCVKWWFAWVHTFVWAASGTGRTSGRV